MKRRDFLKRTTPLLAAPVVIKGLSLRAIAAERRWYGAAAMLGGGDRVLVIIQLEGGNDGLNTIVPVDDDRYYNLRPKLAIAKSDALVMAGEPLLRLHPALAGMRSMFDDGNLGIVANIGYPNATLSHFASTEIWNTASGGRSVEYQRTGWIGRYLQRLYPNYPNVLPSDPPAIEIGGSTSSLFTAVGSSIGMSLIDPSAFYDLVNGGPHVGEDGAAATPAGRELDYVAAIDRQSQSYAESIRAAAAKASNLATYPDTALAASLAIVARLVAGGLATRVYKVTLGNFDTHYNQLERHAALLEILSGAAKAFQDDLIALGAGERVVAMTYSEFGRRPRDNGSGTDHGTTAPHFIFGAPIAGGMVHGGMPDLGSLDDAGNYPFTYNFPCYYASVAAPLFDLDDAALAGVLPIGVCLDRIPLYRAASSGAGRGMESGVAGRIIVQPNPVHGVCVVTLPHARGAMLDLIAVDGTVVRAIDIPSGADRVAIDCSGLASGSYLATVRGSGLAGKIVVR
jgi:uncharacterized protein (DUF1501 family)